MTATSLNEKAHLSRILSVLFHRTCREQRHGRNDLFPWKKSLDTLPYANGFLHIPTEEILDDTPPMKRIKNSTI